MFSDLESILATTTVIFMVVLMGGAIWLYWRTINRQRASSELLETTPKPSLREVEELLEELFEGLFGKDDFELYFMWLSPHEIRERWGVFVLTLSGKDKFPDELPAEKRLDFAMAHRTRGTLYNVFFTFISPSGEAIEIAKKALLHEESAAAARAHIALWEGETMASYLHDTTAKDREQLARETGGDLATRLEGALDIAAGGGGELTAVQEQGSLSAVEPGSKTVPEENG